MRGGPTLNRARIAVLPIAGYGSRFLPATKAIPKAMLPVLDKPLIQYAVEEVRAAGIDRFVFVTGAGREAVAQHFEVDSELIDLLESRGRDAEVAAVEATTLEPGKAAYVSQPQALGLGNAVWCARHLVRDEPFVVVLPDVLLLEPGGFLAEMVDLQAKTGGNVVAVAPVPEAEVASFGILDIETAGGPLLRARAVVEKPAPGTAPSNLGIIGRYVLDPRLMAFLQSQAPGSGGEVQLTDALGAAMPELSLTGYLVDAPFFDCGDRVGMLAANIAAGLREPELVERVAQLIARLGTRPVAG